MRVANALLPLKTAVSDSQLIDSKQHELQLVLDR